MTSDLVLVWRIPRTAGTSLEIGLKQLGVVLSRSLSVAPRASKSLGPPVEQADYVSCKHHTPAALVARNVFTEAEICEATNLICVRNPWDRLVSLFALTRVSGWTHPGMAHWHKVGDDRFSDYVDWATSPVRETDYNLFNHQCQPATDWLFIEGRRVPFHTVGRFEDLPAYWRAVCDVFGMEGELPLANSRAHKPYRDYYTPALRDQVAEFYAAEIEEFGYEF